MRKVNANGNTRPQHIGRQGWQTLPVFPGKPVAAAPRAICFVPHWTKARFPTRADCGRNNQDGQLAIGGQTVTSALEIELRDLDDARRYIVQGLWLQRVVFPPASTTLRLALEWALEIASSGDALPPIGLVADIGIVAFNLERGERHHPLDFQRFSGLPSVLGRLYEDHVLGKLYGDWSFADATDALRRYERGRDWSRGLAFLIRQFRQRAQFPGVLLPPAALKAMLDQPADEVLAQGRDSLLKVGLMPLLEECYLALVEAVRRTPDILSEADVSALQSGIALADESQRLAHELVIRASADLLQALPELKVKPLVGRQEVPTRIVDEDTYPVGGFAAISTRGTIESLLHSQLSFMETDARPDLFDIRYLRDELYYYSRDENQFLRRRRSFVFALFPDLVRARFKDPEASSQRIVLLLGLLRALLLKLWQWLSGDALHFDFLFLPDDKNHMPLTHEHQLLTLLFGEQIANGTITVATLANVDEVARHAALSAAKSECHVLTVALHDANFECPDAVVTRMSLAHAQPTILHGLNGERAAPTSWADALEFLLQLWI